MSAVMIGPGFTVAEITRFVRLEVLSDARHARLDRAMTLLRVDEISTTNWRQMAAIFGGDHIVSAAACHLMANGSITAAVAVLAQSRGWDCDRWLRDARDRGLTVANRPETTEAEKTEKHLRDLLGRKAPETFNASALRGAVLLRRWMGLHNIASRSLREVDWTRPWVELRLRYKSLATYDGADLTSLVFLAHDLALRAEVSAERNCLVVRLHPRGRDGSLFARHPTLESASEAWRNNHPLSEVVP